MALSLEQKKLITDPTILREIERQEQELGDVITESRDRKLKLREQESQHTVLKDRIKKLGLDPDKDDFEEQYSHIFEQTATKKGLKPGSEVEILSKEMKKLKDEMLGWKETATKAEQEALLEKTRTAFSSKLPDIFGRDADLILDLSLRKGEILVEKGIPGVMYDGDFYPLSPSKGQVGGIDKLKQMYPNQVVVKQVRGGSDVKTSSTETQSNNITRASFEQMSASAKMEYMKSGGELTD